MHEKCRQQDGLGDRQLKPRFDHHCKWDQKSRRFLNNPRPSREEDVPNANDFKSTFIFYEVGHLRPRIPRTEAHTRDGTDAVGISSVIGRDDDGGGLEEDEGDVGGCQPRGDLTRVRGADKSLADPRVEGEHRGDGAWGVYL